MTICLRCNNDPCRWHQHGARLTRFANALRSQNPNLRNDQIRFRLYQEYTRLVYGVLGQGNRRRIPECVENTIKALYPSETYTGYSSGKSPLDALYGAPDTCFLCNDYKAKLEPIVRNETQQEYFCKRGMYKNE